MSVFGGDSWAREAQYRKRRVDDLLLEGLDARTSSSSYKKLSTGKYACLVCPHNPVLDTPLMLSMHINGSRHCVAESSLKEKQLVIQGEVNKRIALSECLVGADVSTKSTQVNRRCRLARKPLIEQTRIAASEIFSNKTSQQCETKGNNDIKSSTGYFTQGPFCNSNNNGSSLAVEVVHTFVAQQQSDLQKRQERELKFTAAGWKRDCHGKWFRDENVEFDSDEEDPNVCFT